MLSKQSFWGYVISDMAKEAVSGNNEGNSSYLHFILLPISAAGYSLPVLKKTHG